MPIPSRKELKECVESTNGRDMLHKLYTEKYGWSKVLRFRYPSYEVAAGLPLLTVYECSAELQGCRCAAKGQANYVKKEGNSGIQLTCANCRVTTGLSINSNTMKVIEQKYISIEEALKIVHEDNWLPSPALKDILAKKDNPIKFWW